MKKQKKRKKTISCGTIPWRSTNNLLSILLIKQFEHKESWGAPKGHINKDETIEQCAIRETREETGVNVELGQRLPDIFSGHNNEDKTICTWLAKPIGDDTPVHDDPDSEVADARWFPVDKLPEIHVYQRPLIIAAVGTLWNLNPRVTEPQNHLNFDEDVVIEPATSKNHVQTSEQTAEDIAYVRKNIYAACKIPAGMLDE